MKKYITLVFVFFIALSSCAQNDRFINASDVLGKNIVIINESPASVIYTLFDGKVKLASKVKNISISLSNKGYFVENNYYQYKKDNYLILKDEAETFLLKESDAPLYLSAIRSKTYWDGIFYSLKDDYCYLDVENGKKIHSKDAEVVYDGLSKIIWDSYSISEKEVIFHLKECKGEQMINNFDCEYNTFESEKDVVFISKSNIKPYVDKYNARIEKEKKEQEIADSIANNKVRLALVLEDVDFVIGDEIYTLDKNDTVVVYSYDKEKETFLACFKTDQYSIKPNTIKFMDAQKKTGDVAYWPEKVEYYSEDAEYLKEKGDSGIVQRFNIAKEYDKERTKAYIALIQSYIDDIKEERENRKKNQIFIEGIGYAYDSNEYSNRFGMYFEIYNCFNKTIKYVEFTLTNYNAVGDVQRDDIGYASRSVKGIGPIEPNEGGRYTWNDIFWDDRDVIRKTSLTSIKFIFTDGTSRVFTGASNIKKHMTDDAWD